MVVVGGGGGGERVGGWKLVVAWSVAANAFVFSYTQLLSHSVVLAKSSSRH
jgi:hypothetical protein